MGKEWKPCQTLFFGGLQNHCRWWLQHEIKRHLLPGRKAMTSLVQFSCSVVSDSLWPHESQHARPPCPSPTPGVHSNSCPSTNLDSILKSRDITLPTKVRLVKAMVFSVVMYECESWTIKKAEHRRIDAFELWCWRRLLWVPWTARRSNQSVLKEISPEYSLEGLMLNLKLPILWPPDVKSWLIWKDPDAGKHWRLEKKWQRMR